MKRRVYVIPYGNAEYKQLANDNNIIIEYKTYKDIQPSIMCGMRMNADEIIFVNWDDEWLNNQQNVR